MSRCLTDRAMTRVLAELGTAEERAHLAVCAACAARHRRREGEMAEIAHVLAATPEPRARTARAATPWIAVAATATAVAAGVWLSIETGTRVETPPVRDPRIARALADITTALFSVDGEPRGPVAAPEPDAMHETGCEAAARVAGIYCADAAVGLDEGTGALDVGIGGPAAAGEDGRGEGA